MKLTGHIRYRSTWRGKLILQVQQTWTEHEDLGGSGYYDHHERVGWRDARTEDLTHLSEFGRRLLEAA